MFQDMLAMSSGGGGIKAKYDTFTMPSTGNATVTVDCGFQPSKVFICNEYDATYSNTFGGFNDSDNSNITYFGWGNRATSSGGYGYGYTYITLTSTGFTFTLPNSNFSYIANQTARYLAIE